MDVKMSCLQAERSSPALGFLQAGGAYRTSVLKRNSVRPFLGYRVVSFAEKWQGKGRRSLQWQVKSMAADDNAQKKQKEADESGASSFCIIEGPETLQSFATMQLQEIRDNVRSRRHKIFLLMEEVRRLRIQQRIRIAEMSSAGDETDNEMPDIPSSIPFLPHMTPAMLRQFYATCFSFIGGIILFGGLFAPSLELKLGLGGTSYEDFIRNMHLPMQLSQVDPIIASFSGGAVGVISALMVVEVNNVEQQMHKRCRYCLGTGYLACARCSSTGAIVVVEPMAGVNDSDSPLQLPTTGKCPNCSGVGKVMCPTCLCTGMVMASEHDRRIDPFD